MLLVVPPLALVLAPVKVLKYALSVGLPAHEGALIVLAIRKDLPAETMRLVLMESALVLGAIGPEHNAHAIFDIFPSRQPEIKEKTRAYHSPL